MKRGLVVLVFYSLSLRRSCLVPPPPYRQQSNRFNVRSLIKNAVKEIQRRACVEWDSESEQQINPETSADVRVLLSGTHHQEIPSPRRSLPQTQRPF